MHAYWPVFTTLLATPFEHMTLVWGIVPLYFGLFLNELTSSGANYRTAIQTGFSFLWAAAQWSYAYASREGGAAQWEPVNLMVTALVLIFGLAALWSGLRRRFPRYGRFLGHTRFANYFMITIFPMQTHWLAWTWARLAAIVIFAVPVWLALHFGLMPLRGRK
ncbi:MAG TPA: hypothetical protein VHB20_15500 [Verrucomicrobiae bacterium]|jgi:hypothetical protein|nr:hypothetical protein [Verrucomicrobiae bacterium]